MVIINSFILSVHSMNNSFRQKLLGRCKIFHEREKKDTHFAKAFEKFRNEKVEGILYLLKKWNPRVTGEGAREDIRDALENEKTKDYLDKLSKKTILNFDRGDRKEIVELFGIFREKNNIKITGASKALHLLNQELFVMWDADIRTAYHSLLHRPLNEQHLEGGRDCYFEFLLNCQEFCKEISDWKDPQAPVNVLVSEHMKCLENSEKMQKTWGCYKKCGYRETLAKMIDEFNYITIRHWFVKKPWEI